MLTAHSRRILGIVLFVSSRAWPQPTPQHITSVSGTFTSIPFVFAGMNVQTGPVTASLDPTGVNIFTLDIGPPPAGQTSSQGSASIDVTVRLGFPLLPYSPSIRVIERGAASIVLTTAGYVFNATLSGGGTIGPPTPFQGANFVINTEYKGAATQTFDKNNKPAGFEVTVSATISFIIGVGTVQLPPILGGAKTGLEGGGTLILFSESSTCAANNTSNPLLALFGAWTYSTEGFTPAAQPSASAGRFVAGIGTNEAGNPVGLLTITASSSNDGQIVRVEQDVGSYTIFPNCSGGTLTFNLSTGTRQYDFFFVNGSKMYFVSTTPGVTVRGTAEAGGA